MSSVHSYYANILRRKCRGTFPYLSLTMEEKREIFGWLMEDENYSADMEDQVYDCCGLPADYQGFTVYIRDTANYKCSLLADSYNDVEMLKTESPGKSNHITPLQAWDNDRVMHQVYTHLVAEKKDLTPQNIRQAMYMRNTKAAPSGTELVIRQTSSMRVGWMIGVASYLLGETKGKAWLDPSAGWGDRLIASIVMGMEYRGYDPNTNLRLGHSSILSDFSKDGVKREVKYECFEDSQPCEDYDYEPHYDIVMTSPPYFKQEIYSKAKTQSTSRYTEYDTWFECFLVPLLEISAASVKPGGYICININDYKDIVICKPMVERMESIPGITYMGVLFLSNKLANQTFRPVYVWKREEEDQ